jgi:hypothetical protein
VGDGLADHSGEHSWDRGTHVRPQSSGKSNLADEGHVHGRKLEIG